MENNRCGIKKFAIWLSVFVFLSLTGLIWYVLGVIMIVAILTTAFNMINRVLDVMINGLNKNK